jgi:hypothetical protein
MPRDHGRNVALCPSKWIDVPNESLDNFANVSNLDLNALRSLTVPAIISSLNTVLGEKSEASFFPIFKAHRSSMKEGELEVGPLRRD